MTGGNIVKNAPNSLIWAVTLAFIAVLAASVTLTLNGADSSELWMFTGRLLNALSAVFGGGALVVAGAAAKSAQRADEQTNGMREEERQDIAHKAAVDAVAEYIRREQASGR